MLYLRLDKPYLRNFSYCNDLKNCLIEKYSEKKLTLYMLCLCVSFFIRSANSKFSVFTT